MALSISGPVGDKQRITKPEKKNEKFKAVGNKPADVEVVQLMLVANGVPCTIDGKCTAATIKGIRAFQKSACGFKKPDGIVDPGGKTWKAGLSKLQARDAANRKILENLVVITEGGKEKNITRKEFDRRQQEALKAVRDKANMMHGQAEAQNDFCKEAERTMQGADGVMNQLTEFTVRWANDKANPPYGPIHKSSSEALTLQNLAKASKPDWNKIHKQENKAVRAYNAGTKAFQTYIDARIATASTIVGRLEVVRETSFAIVEAYATARLIATRGMSPAKANAIAAASTEAMKSSSGQFGEYLAGGNVTWSSSAKKIAMDTAFAGAAGAIGGKMSAGMSKKFCGDFAVKLTPKLNLKYFPKEGVEKFTTGFLKSSGGQAFFENMAKETFMLSKTAFTKGKLSQKDFEEAMSKAMTAGMLNGAVGKSLSTFSNRIPGATDYALDMMLKSKVGKGMTPDIMRMYDADTISKVVAKHGDDIIKTVTEKVSGKPIEIAVQRTLAGASGTENEKALEKQFQSELRKSAELRKEIDVLLSAEFGKYAKKLEKAK
jgi:hypothetical protein